MKFIILLLLILSCTQNQNYSKKIEKEIDVKKEIPKDLKIGLIGFHTIEKYKVLNAYQTEFITPFKINYLEDLNREKFISILKYLEINLSLNVNEINKINYEIIEAYRSHGYKSYRYNSYGNVKSFHYYEIKPNLNIDLTRFISFGEKLHKFNKINPKEELLYKNALLFLENYFLYYKYYGIEEIEPLAKYNSIKTSSCNCATTDGLEFEFQMLDLDYLIFSIHRKENIPVFDFQKFVNKFLPSLFTFGYIPLKIQIGTESIFWVYDKKLNLLKVFFYNSIQDVLFSRIRNRERIPSSLYKKNIKLFEKDFIKLIKKRKRAQTGQPL
ncbi:MAG: hypothetical protein KDK36_20465 [Leptospiraceae bacterium]|nr:hypothetical protein [Leptospiraceae bacterium]